jgi:hypothetical protein
LNTTASDLYLSGTVESASSLSVSDVKTNTSFIKNTVVSDEIYFSTDVFVKIYNTGGQLVKTARISENGSLDVSALRTGVYVVEGNVNGTIMSQKIIKK